MTISGKYRIFEDGALVAEADNVLTTAGKKEILGMIAGTSDRISRMVLGVGDAAVSASDTTLHMPYVVTNVDFSVPLFGGASSKIVYKSRLDEGVSGVLWEIGCYNGNYTRNPFLLNWGDATADANNIAGPAGGVPGNEVRMGPTSPQLSTTTPFVISVDTAAGDLKLTDKIALGVKPSTATPCTVTVVLTDASNLTATAVYTTAANTNYQVLSLAISSWSVQSGFDWNRISLASATKQNVANNIIIDGLSILSPTQAGTLLSHAKYTTGVVKRTGVRMDVEYELTFNLG